MTKYVCIGCGFESNESNMLEEQCPYCGEQMVEKTKVITQEIGQRDIE